jgi:multiple sugar transport system permease protein
MEKDIRPGQISLRVIMGIIVFLALVAMFVPFYFLVSTSFKTMAGVSKYPPQLWFRPALEGYQYVLLEQPLTRYFLNSVFVAAGSTLLSIVFGTPAAYALSRFEIRRKEDIAFWILSTRMGPLVAVVLPFFLIYKQTGLYDTVFGMILVHATFNLPFAVWFLRSFVDGIPKSFEEAAIINGCTRLSALSRVVFPLIKPGLAVAAIFCFIFSWNELLLAVILTGKDAATIPVYVTQFKHGMGIYWPRLMAVSTLASIPIVIFTIFSQKHIVRGLTVGALKG